MSQKPRRHGQTLIEFIILLILFAVIGTAVTLTVRWSLDKMRARNAGRQLVALERAFQRFHQKHGHYPEPPHGIRALVESGTIGTFEKDPWGHDLVYRAEGDSLVILSLGKDGKPGGDGADMDRSQKIGPPVSQEPPSPSLPP
jgi:general secretion pathway protein G